MAKWIATITNAGTALLNSQVSGADLVIVGAVSSSTETAAEELAKLTEMTNIKQELTLGSASVDNTNSTFSIPVTLLNDDLEVSYALKQIGIYAQDPTNTENKILFAVAQIDVARVINLPADAPGYKLEIDLNFQNTNNSNVVIQVTDESLRSRVDVLENNIVTKMDNINPKCSGDFAHTKVDNERLSYQFGSNNEIVDYDSNLVLDYDDYLTPLYDIWTNGTISRYPHKPTFMSTYPNVDGTNLGKALTVDKVGSDTKSNYWRINFLGYYYSSSGATDAQVTELNSILQQVKDALVGKRISVLFFNTKDSLTAENGILTSNARTNILKRAAYTIKEDDIFLETSPYTGVSPSSYYRMLVIQLGLLKSSFNYTYAYIGYKERIDPPTFEWDNNFMVGDNNKSKGLNSFIIGNNNESLDYQLVAGHYSNTKTATASVKSGTSGGTAFCVGNGTSSARANAFRVTDNGNVYALSSTLNTGADYAEYFEWQDGNEENEDRVGYFVTFDDKRKIRKANTDDSYILGISSGNPCVIGNGDEDWQGRYVMDDFDRFIKESFEYTETVINKKTGEAETVIKTGTKYKENPEYNSNLPYIERGRRKEWSSIGLMGVIPVRDDGTCQENGYCTVSNGGIATASESSSINTYRVLERVTENIVRVLFR